MFVPCFWVLEYYTFILVARKYTLFARVYSKVGVYLVGDLL